MPDWSAISLSAIEAEDLDAIHRWQNSPEIRDQVMGFRGPVDREATQHWAEQRRRQNGRESCTFVIRHAGRAVGIAQLNDIRPIHRTARFGIYIGDPATRGHGLGLVATALLLDFAFSGLDLRKVNLEVIEGNEPAIRLYRRVGFRHEGTRRQDYFADGRLFDVLLFGLLGEEFAVAIPPEAHRLVAPLPD